MATSTNARANGKHAGPGPAVIDDVLVLENFLPYRLSVLANRASDALAREYSQRFDLGVTEWRVMAVLGHHPGLSANAVARRTAMDKVAVSRAVNRLLASGRLQRRIDPDDRRRSLLRLSRAGRAVYAQVVRIALDFERELLAGVPTAERTQLFHLLDRLDALELRVEQATP
ncbi:MarR family winged helix-turn-helix transcriptional regulator [Thermomonas sp.]|uniref:MarR family winged helix-turn-helix transcriptional regulator n=1 Tax=Thermomonas sp. TaxID=1971895 RepID=UPI002615DE23|nr:MarR family winged helix-turn-helix transcriptional regulator [Thermomonas sp.]